MTIFDYLVLFVLATSVLISTMRGLIKEILSLVSWVVAFLLAQWLALDAARHLPMSGANEPVRYAAGFLLVFVAVVVIGGLVAVVVKKLTAAVGLSPVDRTLGALFGVLRGVLLLLLATVVVQMTPIKDSSVWRESVGVHLADALITSLKPVLPTELNRLLPV